MVKYYLTMRKPSYYLIPLGAVLCFFPGVTSTIALILGIMIALLFGNPYLVSTKKYTPKLLSIVIIGLGAGMNLEVIGKVGFQGIGYTAAGISITLILGLLIGRIFKVQKNMALLIT